MDDRIDANALRSGPLIQFEQAGDCFRMRMHSSRWIVGRSPECDVVLPTDDVGVSRRALLLQRRGRRVLVTNLGRPVVRLGGSPVAADPVELGVGDVLALAGWSISIQEGAVEVPTTASVAARGGKRGGSRHGLVGESPGMWVLYEQIDRVGALPMPALIRGETGSGKERVARALHACSRVSKGPFVAVNCGALLGDTVRSELFGHVRGAFTGADRARDGAFVEADGGTLFLDEIGELSPDVQAALLRTLDLGEVVPVGSTKVLRPTVRIVAATHRDLRTLEWFREDLRYRLDVASLRVPPLRERTDDIPALVAHFLGEGGVADPPSFSDEALEALCAYDWPGNVRELRNVVLRACINARGPTVLPTDLDPELRNGARPAPYRPDDAANLRAALIACDGNRTLAAQRLGIARSTLYEWLRKYDL